MEGRRLASRFGLFLLLLAVLTGSAAPSAASVPASPAAAAVDCSREDITHIPAGECNALVAIYGATAGRVGPGTAAG